MRPEENGVAIQVPYSPNYIVPLVSLLGQIHTNVIPAPYPVKGGHTCNISTLELQSFVCTVKPEAQALTTCIHSKKTKFL